MIQSQPRETVEKLGACEPGSVIVFGDPVEQ